MISRAKKENDIIVFTDAQNQQLNSKLVEQRQHIKDLEDHLTSAKQNLQVMKVNVKKRI